MKKHEDPSLAQFNFVECCESLEGKAAIEKFMVNAVENRCEGLMIKVTYFILFSDHSGNLKVSSATG